MLISSHLFTLSIYHILDFCCKIRFRIHIITIQVQMQPLKKYHKKLTVEGGSTLTVSLTVKYPFFYGFLIKLDMLMLKSSSKEWIAPATIDWLIGFATMGYDFKFYVDDSLFVLWLDWLISSDCHIITFLWLSSILKCCPWSWFHGGWMRRWQKGSSALRRFLHKPQTHIVIAEQEPLSMRWHQF